MKRNLGRAWDDAAIAAARQRETAATFIPIVIVGEQLPFARLWSDAIALALHAEESDKPDAERLPEMQDLTWRRTQEEIISPAPMNRAVEERMLSWTLSRIQAQTGASHPLYRELIGKEGSDALAARLVAGTRLFDLGERQRLLAGDAVAVRNSTDPLITYARDKWVPAMLLVRKDWGRQRRRRL